MKADKADIGDIFINNKLLEIPFFQRSYVWKEDNWSRLLEDLLSMCREEKLHFIGSVILRDSVIDDPADEEFAGKYTVVDGQQRLTTLQVLLRIVSIINKKIPSFDYMFKAFRDDEVWENEFRPGRNDKQAFDRIMSLTELEDLSGEPGPLCKAYEWFRANIDEEKSAILDLKKIQTNLAFVKITVQGDEDEQEIFDSINSLGVRLTTAELLKNEIFGYNDVEVYESTWMPVFEEDSDIEAYWSHEITLGRLTKALIDHFLYSFLQIKVNDGSIKLSSEAKDDFQRSEKLFPSYKALIRDYYNGDGLSILPELMDYAKLYYDNVDTELPASNMVGASNKTRLLTLALGLETSTLIPYILYVLKNNADVSEQEEMFQLLESYVMRRLVSKKGTKNYNRFFTESLIGNGVLTPSELKDYLSGIEGDNTNAFPTDAELEEGFMSSALYNKQAAGVLFFLETFCRDEAKESAELLGLSKYSLEHLMPRKWTPEKWGEPEDEDKRNKLKMTLGNLAIITQKLNGSLQNAAWRKKVEGDGKKGGLETYGSMLLLLGKYLKLPVWDEAAIESRARDLYDVALKAWPSVH